MHVRAYRSLDRRDVTVRNGIPVTTVPRTLVDLSDVLTAHQLANVIHEAAFRKLFDERAVRAAIDQGQRPPQPPRARTRRWSSTRPAAPARKSELEDRFLALTCKSGLPEPLVNTRIQDLEVDFHWPDLNLIVEVDGPGHTRPRTQREDARTRRSAYEPPATRSSASPTRSDC